MKVLYMPVVDYRKLRETKGETHVGDYVADCLFHGFKELLGEDCIEGHPMDHMYKGYPYVHDFVHHGFSMFNRVEKPKEERTVPQLFRMMMNKEFDYIIQPIHHSERNNSKWVLECIDELKGYGYKANQIAVICSDEGPDTNMFMVGNPDCTFFKCELNGSWATRDDIYPIHYSVPKDVFVKEVPEKNNDFAPLMPSFLRRNHPHESTYIYTDEETYYNDYRRSYFGFTCRKGGWDCMRHHEIIACGCVPIFTDIEACPPKTLFRYPKTLARIAKMTAGLQPNYIYQPEGPYSCMTHLHTTGHTIDHGVFNKQHYSDLAYEFLEFGRKVLTTESVAKYVLNTLKGR